MRKAGIQTLWLAVIACTWACAQGNPKANQPTTTPPVHSEITSGEGRAQRLAPDSGNYGFKQPPLPPRKGRPERP